jgi:hypothetical protein
MNDRKDRRAAIVAAQAIYQTIQSQAFEEYRAVELPATAAYEVCRNTAVPGANDLGAVHPRDFMQHEIAQALAAGRQMFLADALAARDATIAPAKAKYQATVATAFAAYIEACAKIESGDLS